MEVYVPLIMPVLWAYNNRLEFMSQPFNRQLTPAERECCLLLSEINLVCLRPVTSSVLLQQQDTLVSRWQRMFKQLYPRIVAGRNWHQTGHLTEDVRLHGPTYSTWVWGSERCGKCLKDINTNGKQVTTTLLSARYQMGCGTLLHARMNSQAQGSVMKESALKAADIYHHFISANQADGSLASDYLAQMEQDLEELESMTDNVQQSASNEGPLQLLNRQSQDIPLNSLGAIKKHLQANDQTHTYFIEGERLNSVLDTSHIAIKRVGSRYTGLAGKDKQFKVWNDAKCGDYRTTNMAHFRDTVFCLQLPDDVYRGKRVYAPDLYNVGGIYSVSLATLEGDTEQLFIVGQQFKPYPELASSYGWDDQSV
jgi:hypothetical protein